MEGGSRKKVKEGKKGKKGAKEGANGSGASTPSVVESNAFKTPISNGVKIVEVAPAVVVEELSSDDKKRRALMKKLTAIDQLKVKKDNGEKLELTQHKKLDSLVLSFFFSFSSFSGSVGTMADVSTIR